jgi:hypothetical protein
MVGGWIHAALQHVPLVECLGVGDVRRSKLCSGGNTAEQRWDEGLPDWNNKKCSAKREKKASTVSDMLNGINKRSEGLPRSRASSLNDVQRLGRVKVRAFGDTKRKSEGAAAALGVGGPRETAA